MIALVAGSASVNPVSGQAIDLVTFPWCHDVTGASMVRALFRPEPEVQSSHVYVRLTRQESGVTCLIPVDQGVLALRMGGFEFISVPSGSYQLTVEGSGLRRVVPLTFAVASPDTLDFDIPLQVENRVLDCLEFAPCANVLSRRTSGEVGAGDDRGLTILAHRLALAVGIESSRDDLDWVACADAEMVAALAEVYPLMAPRTECTPANPTRSRTPYTHAPSGRTARSVEVGGITMISTTSARVSTRFMSSPSGGGAFECTVGLVSGAWVARSCFQSGSF